MPDNHNFPSHIEVLTELASEYAIIAETLEGIDNEQMKNVSDALNAGAAALKEAQ